MLALDRALGSLPHVVQSSKYSYVQSGVHQKQKLSHPAVSYSAASNSTTKVFKSHHLLLLKTLTRTTSVAILLGRLNHELHQTAPEAIQNADTWQCEAGAVLVSARSPWKICGQQASTRASSSSIWFGLHVLEARCQDVKGEGGRGRERENRRISMRTDREVLKSFDVTKV